MARKASSVHAARDPNMAPDREAKMAADARAAAGQSGGTIRIPEQKVQRIEMPVVSEACYISNRMDQKAVMLILADHMQLPKEPRKAKDPYANFQSCIHYLPDGSMGIPGGAFKAAMVSACRQLGNQVKMVAIKQFFHILPDIVRIYGDAPRMCQHVVKNQTGVIDIRFRAMFFRWSALIPIEFDADLISPAMLAVLLKRAGFGVGVGDWRPGSPESFNGRCGRFRVAHPSDVVGPAHTEWCRNNPANEVEMLMAGIVPQDLVDTYRRAATLPPPEPAQVAASAKRTRKRAPESSEEGMEILNQIKAVAARNPFAQGAPAPNGDEVH